MIDFLEKHLDLKADLVEIRAAESDSSLIAVKNGCVENVSSGKLKGFSVRVLKNGAFGFASTNDDKKLKQACSRALKLAESAGRKSLATVMSEEKAYEDRVVWKPGIKVSDISIEDKALRIAEVNKLLGIKRITGFESYYSDSCFSSFFASSEGARISFSTDSCSLAHSVFAKKNGSVQNVFDHSAALKGFEVVEEFAEKAPSAAKRCVSLLDAKKASPGVYDVVLGPKMTGVLAHEAVGHACEADYALMGESILRDKTGSRIGSEHVSISDDSTFVSHYGSYLYDDEGVRGQKTSLIEKGILKGFIHSRETAGKTGIKSTGNSRAESVFHFPLVRMSNINFKKGDFSFDELINLEDGLYAEGFKGGQVLTAEGTYQFAAEQGFVIKNGELAGQLKDVVVIGDILGTLNKVDGVGNKMSFNEPGMCGKGGQSVRVSESSPALRIRGVRIA